MKKNTSLSQGLLLLTPALAALAALLVSCNSTEPGPVSGLSSRQTDTGEKMYVRESVRVDSPSAAAALPKIKQPAPASAPRSVPVIPPSDAQAAQVPASYRVEIALSGLQYPSSIEFGDDGTLDVAEAGNIDGVWRLIEQPPKTKQTTNQQRKKTQ